MLRRICFYTARESLLNIQDNFHWDFYKQELRVCIQCVPLLVTYEAFLGLVLYGHWARKAHCFQKTQDEEKISTDCKNANLNAIFPKGDGSIPVKYVPISLTCITCKVIEHVKLKNILDHLGTLLILFILFSNIFLKDFSTCFTGSPCYNVSYYNHISLWPYYIVIH